MRRFPAVCWLLVGEQLLPHFSRRWCAQKDSVSRHGVFVFRVLVYNGIDVVGEKACCGSRKDKKHPTTNSSAMSVLRVLRHLPSRASPLLAASLMHSDSGTGVSGGASSLHRHSRYWAPEGTVILHCQPGNALYKLDGAALARRSPTYPWAVSGASQAGEEDGIPLFRLPSTLGVAPAELEALLDVFESTDP